MLYLSTRDCVHAQRGVATIPGSAVVCDNGAALQTTVDVKTYVQYAFNLLIALAAVAAVLMIVWGGFEYMTTDAVSGKEDGRKRMTNAIYGLLLVLCSFLILRTINPQFVQVPNSLVVPLGLGSKNTVSDWLTALQSQMDTYHVTQGNVRQQVADAKVALGKLTAQEKQLEAAIADLTKSGNPKQACFDYTGNDVDLNSLCSSLISNLNQQSNLNSNTSLAVGKGEMDNSIIQCSPTGDPAVCANQLTKINSIYASLYSGQLQPDQLKQLSNYGAYARATVEMNSLAAQLYQNAQEGILSQFLSRVSVSDPKGTPEVYKQYQNTLTSINNEVTTYASRPDADPALVKQLKTQQQTVVAAIAAMKYHR